jgi:hypothetical protein
MLLSASQADRSWSSCSKLVKLLEAGQAALSWSSCSKLVKLLEAVQAAQSRERGSKKCSSCSDLSNLFLAAISLLFTDP